MKTPITYYGGKQALLKYLLPLIPDHKIYCEPFFGGGALFFAKQPSEVEIINDINAEVVNFFRVAQTKFAALQKEVQASLHSRKLYKDAMVVYSNPDLFDDVKRAWAFWVVTNQGFSSLIGSWGFGKDDSKEAAVANKREAFTKEYADRLRKVQVEHNDALKIIDRADSKDTFFYIDPPYINSDQGHYAGYTEEEYEKLLLKLSKVKGKFLLSSYPSALLNKYVKKNKWKVPKVSKAVAVTKLTNKTKTEMMVMNYEIMKEKKTNPSLNGLFRKEHDPKIEIEFIERFLSFRDRLQKKKDIKPFIDDLQQAIRKKQIRKDSPYAEQIADIQEFVINFYNKPDDIYPFRIREQWAQELYKVIIDYENRESRSANHGPIQTVDLSGLTNADQIKQNLENLTFSTK